MSNIIIKKLRYEFSICSGDIFGDNLKVLLNYITRLWKNKLIYKYIYKK